MVVAAVLEYPFTDIQLPVLPDCENYFSGKFGEYFWHQNADQVFVFIPVDNDVTKRDVKAKFEAKSVTVTVKGEEEISFQCLERIIPDGSFWLFETDDKGQKYIQLDLEKRFRMINWKGLFGEPVAEEVADIERSEMLKKLFAANKGMSKVTGQPAETITDMTSNEDLVRMISSKIYDKQPEIYQEVDGDNYDNAIDVTEDSSDDDNDGDILQKPKIIDGEIVEE